LGLLGRRYGALLNAIARLRTCPAIQVPTGCATALPLIC